MIHEEVQNAARRVLSAVRVIPSVRPLSSAQTPDTDGSKNLLTRGPASYLKVEVLREGERVVAVRLPAARTADLVDLIPPQALAGIRARGIDLEGIIAQACAQGLRPGPLFDLELGKKHYRVWLAD